MDWLHLNRLNTCLFCQSRLSECVLLSLYFDPCVRYQLMTGKIGNAWKLLQDNPLFGNFKRFPNFELLLQCYRRLKKCSQTRDKISQSALIGWFCHCYGKHTWLFEHCVCEHTSFQLMVIESNCSITYHF